MCRNLGNKTEYFHNYWNWNRKEKIKGEKKNNLKIFTWKYIVIYYFVFCKWKIYEFSTIYQNTTLPRKAILFSRIESLRDVIFEIISSARKRSVMITLKCIERTINYSINNRSIAVNHSAILLCFNYLSFKTSSMYVLITVTRNQYFFGLYRPITIHSICC